MSGIAAVLQPAAPEQRPRQMRELLRNMLGRLGHRGEVDTMNVADGVGAVGRCTSEDELACFPGSAPASGPVGDRLIVADARIDNRDELRRDLGLVNGSSDGQIILAAYRRWGAGCARRLVGDFAFAILDVATRRLFCARDPFGVRPLYYCAHGGLWRCATEVQALFADAELPQKADLDQLALFIICEHTESDGTLYAGVSALPPAHHLMVDERGTRLQRYWAPDPWCRLRGLGDDEYAERLREAITEAIRCRLPATGRVGVYVSGGLDSSAVAGEVARLRLQGEGPEPRPMVLHATFSGSPEDETVYSNALADKWELPRINACPLDDRPGTRPCALPGHPDVLYDPRLAMWSSLIGPARQQGVRTTMSGEGLDLCLRPTGVELADALRQGQVGELLRGARRLGAPGSVRAWHRVWQSAGRPLVPDAAVRAARRVLRRGRLLPPLAPRYAEHVLEHLGRRRHTHRGRDFPDLVTREICTYIEESSYPAVMANCERFELLNGMLVTHPTQDRRVVELVLSMPHEQRHVVGLVKPKPVLRRAMAHVLPDTVRCRRTAGQYRRFMRQVLFGIHRSTTAELLAHSRLLALEVVTPKTVDELRSAQVEPGHGASALSAMVLSNIVALEIWLRQL